MQTFESIGPMRSLVLRWRLFARFLRLSSQLRWYRRANANSEARHKRAIEMIQAENARQVRRVEEQNAALQTKVEIIQRECLDRILEAQRLIGMSFATRESDDRIQETRYRPFEEAKREAVDPKRRLYNDLAPEAKAAYDAEYESHVSIGRGQGLDDAEIDRFWRANEDQIVDAIGGGNSVSGGY